MSCWNTSTDIVYIMKFGKFNLFNVLSLYSYDVLSFLSAFLNGQFKSLYISRFAKLYLFQIFSGIWQLYPFVLFHVISFWFFFYSPIEIYFWVLYCIILFITNMLNSPYISKIQRRLQIYRCSVTTVDM